LPQAAGFARILEASIGRTRNRFRPTVLQRVTAVMQTVALTNCLVPVYSRSTPGCLSTTLETHRDSGRPLCHHWPISIEVSNLASPKLCHRTKKTECCYANCMHLRNVLALSEMSSIVWCFSSVLSSFVQDFKSTHTSHH
jgi:hypothetical protein